ncbi:dihydroorotase [Paenarthrobacter nicotinovorans]|jgi:dihydroorotase|uniref:dihydroorotase n=1 Tax=Paenarthrobacter nicotinovorans TaxID=29320 RepID=UPI003801E136
MTTATRQWETGQALHQVILTGVLPYGKEPTDVLISDGKFVSFVPSGHAPAPDTTVVDATGLIMLPGFVDLHTHLREPGGEASETVATGTRSAAAGGFTDVFAMANTDPVTDTGEKVRYILDLAETHAHCRVHPVGAITKGLEGLEPAPYAEMANAGARMFSDDGRCVNNAALTRDAMLAAARLDCVLAQHAQSGDLAGAGQINAGPAAESTGLPPWLGVAEETIIARDAILAAETGARLHVCHISTRRSADIIRWAKSQGWPVTAEVTPHHLLLSDELAALTNTRYKVNPPLRSADDVRALRAALLDGTIDAVATDHAPHTDNAKAGHWCDAPFGMTGLETALPVVAKVLDEAQALDWGKVAELMSVTPARIGGISSFAGRPLAAGEPATFTLIDSTGWTVNPENRYSKSANNPFEGTTFRHKVVATSLQGRLIHTLSEGLTSTP